MYDPNMYNPHYTEGNDNFAEKMGEWLTNPDNLGSKGKVKYGRYGELIPLEDRQFPDAIRNKNPYGITAGNAINPNTSFTDVLAKANKPFSRATDDIYGGGAAY